MPAQLILRNVTFTLPDVESQNRAAYVACANSRIMIAWQPLDILGSSDSPGGGEGMKHHNKYRNFGYQVAILLRSSEDSRRWRR